MKQYLKLLKIKATYIIGRQRVSDTGPFTKISMIVAVNKLAFLWVPTKAGNLKSSFMPLSTT